MVGLLLVLVIALVTLCVCRLAASVVLERPAPRSAPSGPPVLPRADQPPAGLTPLIPSPRAVAEEVQRGLRDLQLWLVDQRG